MRAVRYHAKRGNPNFSFQFGDEMSINPQNIEIIFRFGFSRNAELRRIWREILLFPSSVSPSRSEFEKSRNENFLTDLNKPNLETFPTELQKNPAPVLTHQSGSKEIHHIFYGKFYFVIANIIYKL